MMMGKLRIGRKASRPNTVSAEAASSEVEEALLGGVEGLLPDQVVAVYPYLARLLELPLQGAMQDRVQYLTPEALQQRILRAVTDYVRARALEQATGLACRRARGRTSCGRATRAHRPTTRL